MRVACHQPYFLPPLSFFAKWRAADALIVLDELQFVRKSSRFHYANRCKLGDDRWYTVPVVQQFPQRISDTEVVAGWSPSRLTDRIRNDYRECAVTRDIAGEITDALRSWDGRGLARMNVSLLRWAARRLGITSPLYLQSELGVDRDDRDERLVALVRRVGGTTYVAGPSGPSYMNEGVYDAAGLSLEVCRHTPRPYARGSRPWVPFQSVVDVCCYAPDEAAAIIDADVVPWPRVGAAL